MNRYLGRMGLLLLLSACSGSNAPPDAGSNPDSGTTLDAGATDSGTHDAGSSDAGSADAGGTDAGLADSGVPPDSGFTDAGSPDSGSPTDAGPCVLAVGPATCTAGTLRCNCAETEVCNNSGTAWLYLSTCSQSCSAGLCIGACTPGATRCNGANAEQCNAGGTAWSLVSTCSTFCDIPTGSCAQSAITINANPNATLDGTVVVAGDVSILNGSTLTSPSGNLTLRASTITVDATSHIVVTPTGMDPRGKGGDGTFFGYPGSGGGGGYGTAGFDATGTAPGLGGAAYETTDATVYTGSAGGAGNQGSAGAAGGGVLRLIAPTITLSGSAGAVGAIGASSATGGGGGGGSGGGILLAAGTQLAMSGMVTVLGGSGGSGVGATDGGTGGNGRAHLVYGNANSLTGTVLGTQQASYLPPLTLTSSTHPDARRWYNDGAPALAFAWDKPFSQAAGYYWLLDQTYDDVPGPANATYGGQEALVLTPQQWFIGTNYFHIVTVGPFANVGTMPVKLTVNINSTPPSVSSSSHPNPGTWYANVSPYFTWTYPHAVADVSETHYVFDHDGSTVPTASDPALPANQQQVLLANQSPGVWAFHLVAMDAQGNPTQSAAIFRVYLGTDPGSGTVTGTVVDATSQPIAGAIVTINHGLFTPTRTDATGHYSLQPIPAGTWQLTASAGGHQTVTQQITVNAAMTTTANFTLP